MEKKETFWADAPLTEKLATIPRSEKSTIIRMALRQWFGISNTRPVEVITAQQVARELMANLKIERGRS